MIKLADVVKEIVDKNPLLKFGISYRFLNLSRLAKFIHPQVEVRAKKEVRPSAITMTLSRLQRIYSKISPKISSVVLENITVHVNLCTFTFFKSPHIHKKINRLYEAVLKKHGYMTVTEGVNEITVIVGEPSYDLVKSGIDERPKNTKRNLAALGVKFPERYNSAPGLLYLILQQLTLQHINIVEITSTYTELFLYVDKKDVHVAFDTLMAAFSGGPRG